MHRAYTGRIYDSVDESHGRRVLVDRVWPRGIRKADARIDDWLKSVAPTSELRKWYGHDPKRYEEFARTYRGQLTDDDHADSVAQLREWLTHTSVTLLTAAKDVEHSHVPIIIGALEQ